MEGPRLGNAEHGPPPDRVDEPEPGDASAMPADPLSGDPLSWDVAPPVAAPSREDPVVRVASAVAGGPAGRRVAVTAGIVGAVPVLVLLAVAMLGAGVVQKQHCRTAGWSSPDMFWHACYTDIPVLYSSAHLGGDGSIGPLEAVRSAGLGQPPLTSIVMWLVAAGVGSGDQARAPRAFFDLSAVVLAVLLAVAVAAVAMTAGRRRAWDAAHVALAPVLVTAGLLSYQLLGVALLALALLAWSRSRPLAAGLLLGAAACAAPAAAVVAVAVVALGLRAGRVRPAVTFAVAAGAVWFGVRLLAYPNLDGGLPTAWEGWKDSGPGYGSLWLVPSLLEQIAPAPTRQLAQFWPRPHALSPTAATVGTLLCLVAVAVATLVLALSTRRRPRLAHVALFATAFSLVALKSLPVQSSLVLLPLIALAGLRWRDHLIWATTEVAYFVGVWIYIAGTSVPNRGLPPGFYLVLLVARLAGIAWLGVQAYRAALDPRLDPVRAPTDGAPGEDDPAGGAYRGAQDRLVVELA
jgi:hypothetical protein